jgi:cytoskeleton protein RodZ
VHSPDDKPAPPAPSAGAAAPDFGSVLREAREKRGVSLRQIAVNTKISMLALEALERNDIRKLPGGIFSRAFVRSYAREVGLDPERTVREFVSRFPDQGGHEEAPAPHEEDGALAEHVHRWYGGALRVTGFLVPIVLVVLYFGFGQRLWPRAPDNSRASAPQPAAAEATERATAPPPAMVPVPAPAETPAVVAEPSAAEPSSGLAPTDPDTTLVIRLAPGDDCWVLVTVDQDEPFQQLMRAGETRQVRAREQVVLTVGNAGVLAYSVNGLPGRSLGSPGAVVKDIRITRENYKTFIESPR